MILTLLTALPLWTLAADFSGQIQVDLAPWKAPCTEQGCGLPQALDQPTQLTLQVPATSGPQSSGVARGETLWTTSSGIIQAKLTLFAVEPSEKAPYPPYLQLKLEVISNEASAVCAQSVRWKRPFEAPPLICGALSADGKSQLGVTMIPRWEE
jgi:hypothetical protein